MYTAVLPPVPHYTAIRRLFFSPFNTNWKNAVSWFRQNHIGQPLTKKQFAPVFKEAWIDTVKARTIVNSFYGSWNISCQQVTSKIIPSCSI